MGVQCSRASTVEGQMLLQAVKDADVDVVLQFLAGKPGLATFATSGDRVCPLHVASGEGNIKVLHAICDALRPAAGASSKELKSFYNTLNKVNCYGQTALMLACKNGHATSVQYLLSQGANPLVCDKVHLRTCLHYAAWNGWTNCLEVLLDESTLVRTENGLVGPACHAFVQDACGRHRFVDIRSESGFTPLHFAVSGGNLAATKCLLRKGASTTAQVVQGNCYSVWPVGSSPLHIAAAKGSTGIVRCILQAAAAAGPGLLDPRTLRDAHDNRPLEVALSMNHHAAVAMLDPALTLQEALALRRRSRLTHGPASLAVLAGRTVREMLITNLVMLESTLAAVPSADIPVMLSAASSSDDFSRQSSDASSGDDACFEDAAQRAQQPGLTLASSAVSKGCCTTCKGASLTTLVGEDPRLRHDSSTCSCCCPTGSSAKPDTVAAAARLLEKESLWDDDDACGVCLDSRPQVAILGCSHQMCIECAKKVCSGPAPMKTVVCCPFCRGPIAGFTAAS